MVLRVHVETLQHTHKVQHCGGGGGGGAILENFELITQLKGYVNVEY